MKKIGVGNMLYLAYGSNLNLMQMERRCPYAVPLGPAELTGYRLLFRGGKGSAVATVEPQEGSSVPVLLWEITPRCEEALDVYEGFPRLYRKETVTVSFSGKRVEAMVYIMNRGRLGTPGKFYYDCIAEGYKTAGFDVDILYEAACASRSLAKQEQQDCELPRLSNKLSGGFAWHSGNTQASEIKRKWTSESCIDSVERFIAEHDRFPRTEDFLKNKALPLPPTFKHHTKETIGEYLSRHPLYDTASERYVIGRFARHVD